MMPSDNLKFVTKESYDSLELDAVNLRKAYIDQANEFRLLEEKTPALLEVCRKAVKALRDHQHDELSHELIAQIADECDAMISDEGEETLEGWVCRAGFAPDVPRENKNESCSLAGIAKCDMCHEAFWGPRLTCSECRDKEAIRNAH